MVAAYFSFYMSEDQAVLSAHRAAINNDRADILFVWTAVLNVCSILKFHYGITYEVLTIKKNMLLFWIIFTVNIVNRFFLHR